MPNTNIPTDPGAEDMAARQRTARRSRKCFGRRQASAPRLDVVCRDGLRIGAGPVPSLRASKLDPRRSFWLVRPSTLPARPPL